MKKHKTLTLIIILLIGLLFYSIKSYQCDSFNPSNWSYTDQKSGIVAIVAFTITVGGIVLVETYKSKPNN